MFGRTKEQKDKVHSSLGKKYRDRITGFEGVAIARTDWLYGCSRLGLQSQKLKDDGTVADPVWFDEYQLEEIETVVEKKSTGTGGPQNDPTVSRGPAR